MNADSGTREILIEMTVLGAYAKATAIDAAAGAEASITGPVNAPRAALEAAAVKNWNMC